MNKKISFKRPGKPATPEADNWVKAGGDDAGDERPQKKAAVAKTPARKRKPAASRPKAKPELRTPVNPAPAPSSVTAAAAPSEIRWLNRTLDSIDRQLETVSARIVTRLNQASPRPDDLLRETDQKVDRTIARLEDLKKALRES